MRKRGYKSERKANDGIMNERWKNGKGEGIRERI